MLFSLAHNIFEQASGTGADGRANSRDLAAMARHSLLPFGKLSTAYGLQEGGADLETGRDKEVTRGQRDVG